VNDQILAQPEPSDETLVARVVQRDVTALARLYDRYGQAIYAMATYLLGSADAEEIVQEVFLRLWRRADQFDLERGTFKPWFMTIARHRVRDELRRRNLRQQFIAAEDIERLLANTQDPLVDVEREAGLHVDGQRMLEALKTLPAEQRRVLVLAYFGGLSQSSIAQQLGAPLGTVKKRIRLGLQKLRAVLVADKLTVEAKARPRPAETNVRNEL